MSVDHGHLIRNIRLYVKMIQSLLIATALLAAVPVGALAGNVERVLIIGLDGCRPDIIRLHAGPNLRSLIDNGAVFWNGQSDLPSVTQVNWTSILAGSSAERHGIDRHPIDRRELDEMRPTVPTLFEVLARQGLACVGFLGHWKLHPTMRVPAEHATLIHSPYEARNVSPLAARHILEDKPVVCFVWMGDLDGIGHQDGWMSQAQIDAMQDIDHAIGALTGAVKDAGVWDSTLVVVCSDHGGEGHAHGEGRPIDRRVPIIFAGPGVTPGGSFDDPVSVTDIAPTILALMGIKPPASWDGRPIEAIAGASATPINTPNDQTESQ